jgi:nucleoside phosphorylase
MIVSTTSDTTRDQAIEHVLILMAMRDEATPVIEALNLAPLADALDPRLPMRCYRGILGRLTITLGIAGVDERYDVDNVGSEPAAVLALETIRSYAPDLVISAGTAGGFASRGANIATVYLSQSHFVFHDRHVPLDGFRESAIGGYPALDVSAMAQALAFPTGVISTGSSLEKSDRDLEVLGDNAAVAKEMEAAGIAWVAMLYGVPMLAVKSITNIVDQNNQSETEFVRNFTQASASLTQGLCSVLRYLDGRRIGDLAAVAESAD